MDRHVYDNVALKDRHIYENVRELRDDTPDLILAVKPKVPLEEEQVTSEGGANDFLPSRFPCRLILWLFLQFMGTEFGDDKASASDPSLCTSRLSCVDRAERNSRALSLHNSITKSESQSLTFVIKLTKTDEYAHLK